MWDHKRVFLILALVTSWSQQTIAIQAAEKSSKTAGPNRWALLIGVDDYSNADKLHYCGADMRALAERLIAAGFPKDHVYILDDRAEQTKYRPMKANIETQLKLVLRLVEKDDLVVVGFSGHGAHMDGKSYLCPSETKLDDPDTMIPLDTVYGQLAKCPAALKLFLVDACRDDPRPGGQKSLKPTEGTKQFAASLEKPPQGILLLTSCAPGEISMEEKEFGHGVFMHFVLEGLGGQADSNHNGWVSLGELWTYANGKTKSYVARQFNELQRPSLKGEVNDDFDLVRADARIELPRPMTGRETEPLRPSQVSGNELTNSIGMKLTLIPAGEFMMGSGDSAEEATKVFKKYYDEIDAKSFSDEYPRHRVRITRPFYLGTTEVTVGQFRQFVANSGYKTNAEKDWKGGYGFDANTDMYASGYETAFHWSWRCRRAGPR